MIYRLATRADEPAIQEVIRTVYVEYNWPWYPEGYHLDLYDIQQHYFDRGNLFWVVEEDGVVFGTVALDFYKRLPGEEGLTDIEGTLRVAGSDCSLERLYVLPQYRGKGAGYGLWKLTLDAAKERGCHRQEIWSDKRLEDAHKMYEKKGAYRVGERLCHDPEQSPEWGMAFDL